MTASTETTGTRKVLVIAENYGPEQDELLRPVRELRDAGLDVTVAAPTRDPIQTLVLDAKPGETITPDTTLAEVNPDDYDVLVVPGGTLNADSLRIDADAQRIAHAFADRSLPIASICHGPWLLAETGIAKDRRLTSYISVRSDLQNAGADWTDEAVVVDETGGSTIITSRTPNDLDAFIASIRKVLGA